MDNSKKEDFASILEENNKCFRNENLTNDEKWGSLNFPWTADVDKLREDVFGIKAFRFNQRAIINAVLSNKDVFINMPTAGGKSICFQLPALISKGLTVVIMPLLSLIIDQEMQMISLGIQAMSICGDDKEFENELLFKTNIESNKNPLKILFTTPEKISRNKNLTQILISLHKEKKISRFIIDEAHCVSMWGNSFRKEYLNLSFLKDDFEGVQIIALTATSTSKVKNDITTTLQMKDCLHFQNSFNRKNLFYEVWNKYEKEDEQKNIYEVVNFIKENYPRECGIIYTTTRNDCEDIANTLSLNYHIKSKPYHAGISNNLRKQIQNDWNNDSLQVIVATIAFGMGINKSNVRFVIHWNIPKSMEDFYQESGRAGRDGNKSHCIILYAFKDRLSLFYLLNNSEVRNPESKIQDIYKMIKLCEDQITCLRKMILNHFGEEFNSENCAMCYNCTNSTTRITKDITEIAKATKNILNYKNGNLSFTLIQIKNLLSGKNDGKKLQQCEIKNYINPDIIKRFTEKDIEKSLIWLISQNYFCENLKSVRDYQYSIIGIGNKILNDSNEIKIYQKSTIKTRENTNFESIIGQFKNKSLKNEETKELSSDLFRSNFGFCLTQSNFDILSKKLKDKRNLLFTSLLDKDSEMNSFDTYLPQNTIEILCKWLPTNMDDLKFIDITGLSYSFLKRFSDDIFPIIQEFKKSINEFSNPNEKSIDSFENKNKYANDSDYDYSELKLIDEQINKIDAVKLEEAKIQGNELKINFKRKIVDFVNRPNTKKIKNFF